MHKPTDYVLKRKKNRSKGCKQRIGNEWIWTN